MNMNRRRKRGSGQPRNQSRSGVANPNVARASTSGSFTGNQIQRSSLNRVPTTSSTVNRPASASMPPTPPQLTKAPGGRPLVRRSFATASGLSVQVPRVVSNMPGGSRPQMVVSGNMNNNRINMIRTNSSSSTTSNLNNSSNNKQCCCCCIGSMCSHGSTVSTANVSNGVAKSQQGQPSQSLPAKDRSIINQTINSGTPNVRLMVKSVIEGTAEMKDLILNELDLIFECRLCKNLFRSLINFVDHKRNYCKTHACESMILFDPLAIRYQQELEQQTATSKKAATATVDPVEDQARERAARIQARRESQAEEAVQTMITDNQTASSAASDSVPDKPSEIRSGDEPTVTMTASAASAANGSKVVKTGKSIDKCLEKLIRDKTPSSSPTPPLTSELTPSQSVASSTSSKSMPFNLPVPSMLQKQLQQSNPVVTGVAAVKPIQSSSPPKSTLLIKPISSNPNAVYQRILTPSRSPSQSSLASNSSSSSGSKVVAGQPLASGIIRTQSMVNAAKSSTPDHANHQPSPMDRNNNLDHRRNVNKTYTKAVNAPLPPINVPGLVKPRIDYSRSPKLSTSILSSPSTTKVINLDSKPLQQQQPRPSTSTSLNRRPSITSSLLNKARGGGIGRKVVECTTCKQKFDSGKTLNVHIRTIHNGAKSTRIMFPCVYCPLTFSQLCNGNRHLQVVHKKSKQEVDTLKMVMKQGARPSNKFKARRLEFERLQEESAKGSTRSNGQWVNGSGVIGGAGHQIFVPDVEVVMDDIKQIYARVLGDGADDGPDHGDANDSDGAVDNGLDDVEEDQEDGGDFDGESMNSSSRPDSGLNGDVKLDGEQPNPEMIPGYDHICRGCGRYFPRAAAKDGHEKSCSKIPRRKKKARSTQSVSSTGSGRGRKRLRLDGHVQRASLDGAEMLSSIESGSINGGSASSAEDKDQDNDPPVAEVNNQRDANNHVELVKQLFESNQAKSLDSNSNFGIEMDPEIRDKLNGLINISNLKCVKCPDKSFAKESALVHHSLSHHLNRSIYKCKGCIYSSIDLTVLDLHLLNKHGIKAPAARRKLMINLSDHSPLAPSSAPPIINASVGQHQQPTKHVVSTVTSPPDINSTSSPVPTEPFPPYTVTLEKVTTVSRTDDVGHTNHVPVVEDISDEEPDAKTVKILSDNVTIKMEESKVDVKKELLKRGSVIVGVAGEQKVVVAEIPSKPENVEKKILPAAGANVDSSQPPLLDVVAVPAISRTGLKVPVVVVTSPKTGSAVILNKPLPPNQKPMAAVLTAKTIPSVPALTPPKLAISEVVAPVKTVIAHTRIVAASSTPSVHTRVSMATPPAKQVVPNVTVKVVAPQPSTSSASNSTPSGSHNQVAISAPKQQVTDHLNPPLKCIPKLLIKKMSPTEDNEESDDDGGDDSSGHHRHHHHHKKKKKYKKIRYDIISPTAE